MLEMLAAIGLMAVLIALCLQMLAATAAARRASERRAVALQEATNLLERVSTIPWSEVTAERLSEVDVSPEVRALLPGAKARLLTEGTKDNGPPGKRVRVEITWTNATGDADAPVGLTTWMYDLGTEAAQ